MNGYWSFLFLGRWSMVQAWLDRLRQPFNRSNEFVSRDARRISDPRNYEMLTSPQQVYQPKTPDDIKKGPDVNVRSHRTLSADSQEEDYFGSDATCVSPSISFSQPIPPSRSASAAARCGSLKGQGRTGSLRGNYPSSPPSGMVRMGSLSERDRSGSALGLDRIGSPAGQNRTGSALSHHRAGSSLGRDWDPSSTYARPSNGPLPEERSSAQVREWDPIQTHARAGDYIAQNWALSGHKFWEGSVNINNSTFRNSRCGTQAVHCPGDVSLMHHDSDFAWECMGRNRDSTGVGAIIAWRILGQKWAQAEEKSTIREDFDYAYQWCHWLYRPVRYLFHGFWEGTCFFTVKVGCNPHRHFFFFHCDSNVTLETRYPAYLLIQLQCTKTLKNLVLESLEVIISNVRNPYSCDLMMDTCVRYSDEWAPTSS